MIRRLRCDGNFIDRFNVDLLQRVQVKTVLIELGQKINGLLFIETLYIIREIDEKKMKIKLKRKRIQIKSYLFNGNLQIFSNDLNGAFLFT